MKAARANDIIRRAAKFTTLRNADSFVNRVAGSGCYLRIVMGDCDDDGGVYWVVSPANAEILRNVGYEII